MLKTFSPALAVIALWLSACTEPATLFELIPAEESGLTFANRITENDTFNILDFEFVYNGGGVGAADFDGDGRTDLYFTGNTTENRLFLNRGDFHFEDVTEVSGTSGRGRWCGGVSVADVNADGRPDIYVSATIYEPGRRRANLLYINRGIAEGATYPTFTEEAATCGLADTSHTTQSAFFDYDRDGDLDLYLLINEMDDRAIPNRYLPKKVDGSGRRNDKLLRNEGPGPDGLPRFVDVTEEANILKEGYGLGLNICDLNRDGWPDIYVTNDYLSNDLLWINNQDGTFTDRAADYFKHTAYSAMGNDVADLNNDGLDDIVALDMFPENNLRRKAMMPPNNYNAYLNNERFGYQQQFTRNMLQLNRGKVPQSNDYLFSDIGMQAGIAATDWSWSPLAADFDHDGDRDLLITNGFPRDVTDRDFMDYNVKFSKLASREVRLAEIPSVKIANYAYENDGHDIPHFTKRTVDWGLDHPSFSNGAIFADLDNDGDLDYVVNNINDSCFLFRNSLIAEGAQPDSSHWLRLRLVGEGQNTEALGARVEIDLTNGEQLTGYQHPTRGFLSSVADGLHFGFGPGDRVEELRVIWPDGRLSHIERPALDQVRTLRQVEASKPSDAELADADAGSGNPRPLSLIYALPYLHEDFPMHRDCLFIDFNVQPLLPHKLSEYGPGLAVGDMDGDGLDDLYRSGSHFYHGLLKRQLRTPTTAAINLRYFATNELSTTDPEPEELGSLFFDADGDGDQDLYLATGGSEYPIDHPVLQDRLLLNDGAGNFSPAPEALPGIQSSASCVSAADYDRDGDLDLFVGGRLQPARFPEAVNSYVLINDGQGRFEEADIPALNGIGLVCAALWTDTDQDGWTDLLLVGQGMGPRLFHNREGQLQEATPSVFNDHVGWYNSLTAADFDLDGDLDYVVGNFGHNHLYRGSGRDYVGLYGADYDGNGGYDLLVADLALDEAGEYREFPHAQRTDTEKQLISVKQIYERHDQFGRVTIDEVIANYPNAEVTALKANFLGSAWIENLGDGAFSFHELPRAAQLAPIFGVQTLYVNDDPYPDLVAIGNEYGAETGMGTMDALNGVVLLWNPAKNNFAPLDRQQHEFFVPGNGRSLATIVVDDQPVLIATENKGPTRAFRVRTDAQQVHRLKAGENTVSFTVDGRTSIAEYHYGGGYLSQNSRMVLLPRGAEIISTATTSK